MTYEDASWFTNTFKSGCKIDLAPYGGAEKPILKYRSFPLISCFFYYSPFIFHFFKCDETIPRSLSPLPERLMIIMLSFFILKACCIAYATACELSRAGIMPSRLHSVLKALRA
jgi:hypothetical protein